MKELNNSFVIKSFARIFLKNKRLTLLLIAAVVGSVLISLIPPQILKLIIDKNLNQKISDGLMKLALMYIIVVAFIGIFDFVKEAVLTIFGQKVTTVLRAEMMKKLERTDIGFFSSNGSGEVVSRIINDVDAINSMFTNGIVGMATDCFKIIGIVVSVWIFSPRLGVIVILLLPFIYLITRTFQKRMLKAQIMNRILVGKVNNHIGESIKNTQMIKVYSKEVYMENKYKKILTENYRTVEKVNFYDSVFPPVIQITRAFVIGMLVVVSSKQLNFLGMTLGMIAASIDLISNLFAPVEQLGMELQNIQQAMSGVQRVNEFFDEKEESPKNKEYTAAYVIPSATETVLEFHNVSFCYEEENEVLSDINIKIDPCEKATFTGRTGVGKSTLFKLVLGLLKPTDGKITINGIDVCDIPNTEKRRIFGYVDQSFHMIKGSVADQITLLDKNITREQVEEALEYVGMLEYIRTFENGCDTQVFGNELFSQGQKQLLSIARAIVTSPPILLLDEITANLDSITEEKILKVMKKAESQHMVLSISHRISSIASFDKVIVLESRI